MSDVRGIINPERKFFRDIGRSLKNDSLDRLLYRGVVQFVDTLGNEERPRFSLRIKVLGIDGPGDKTEGRWFPPLLPIHQIAIPEVGEEVILICEEIGNINSAFWISRSVTENTLVKNEIGAGIKDEIDKNRQPASSQYGFDTGKPPKESLISPNEKYPIPEVRVKPGDVVSQGRSNTFDRHTFDTKNKRGYVETITEEKPVPDDSFYQDDFRKSDGTRIVQATKTDLDSLILEKLNDLKFDRSYLAGVDGAISNGLASSGYPSYHTASTSYSSQDDLSKITGISTPQRAQNKLDTAYLLLEALELRIISRHGKEIQHTVLAEEQERWLIILINLVKDLIDDLVVFRDHIDDFRSNIFEKHKHMANGPTSPPLNGELGLSRGQFKQNLSDDKNQFQTDKNDFEKHKKPIPIHHSQTIAIN